MYGGGAAADGDEEVPLTGGDVTTGLVRVGVTVRRPRQPSSDAVAAYLAHLAAAGFAGAPRWLGVDGKGRDVLDYIEGIVPASPPEPWAVTDEVLAGVGRLLRRLHTASAAFRPPAGATWFGDDIVDDVPADAAIEETLELVSHCDVTPQNVVFRDGNPVALIDFDMSRPTSRLIDVINTAMHWVPLKHPRDRGAVYDGVDVASRLRLIADAYDLDDDERARFVDLAARNARRSWYRMRANAEHRGGGWARMWDEGVGDVIARRGAWLIAERDTLELALRGGQVG